MFKISATFVTALLAVAAYASPALETRQAPNQVDTCRPSTSVSPSTKFFIQSTTVPKVWQAQDVTTDNFIFVNLQAQAAGSNPQLWSIFPINHGDSFALVSDGVSAATVCANGDGGPLDSAACPNVASRSADQFAQWFITCKTCGSNGSGTGCQIQSAGEGQCVNFLSNADTTVKLDDCSSTAPNQFWNINTA